MPPSSLNPNALFEQATDLCKAIAARPYTELNTVSYEVAHELRRQTRRAFGRLAEADVVSQFAVPCTVLIHTNGVYGEHLDAIFARAGSGPAIKVSGFHCASDMTDDHRHQCGELFGIDPENEVELFGALEALEAAAVALCELRLGESVYELEVVPDLVPQSVVDPSPQMP